MTSASGLFSNHLRSRSGTRNPNPNPSGVALPSDPHRLPRRRRRNCRHGHHFGASGHRLLDADDELLHSDSSNPENLRTGNGSNSRTARSRVNELNIIRSGEENERLPSTVVQAQARLLERLRGVSLTGNRQSGTASDIPLNEYVIESDFVNIHPGDWETEVISLWNRNKKKPPGSSLESICSLQQEDFLDVQESDGDTRASLECPICLEKFCAGDRFFRLACCHRFHRPCLETWLQYRGECPCCRASI